MNIRTSMLAGLVITTCSTAITYAIIFTINRTSFNFLIEVGAIMLIASFAMHSSYAKTSLRPEDLQNVETSPIIIMLSILPTVFNTR